MSERTDQLLEELVRLEVHSLRASMESQAEAIEVLANLGFETPRIAELLQTTAGTVRAARQRSSKKATSAKKSGK